MQEDEACFWKKTYLFQAEMPALSFRYLKSHVVFLLFASFHFRI
ncbi:hypothetical protein TSMEX_011582 [Taenia solium]|eukprot:TsM_000332300 transcript=TsM_000332300 gene=TsM_000332300